MTDLLTSLNDTHAGTFTATYGPDGALLEQTYPGGIMATTTYDPTGMAVALTFNKTTDCSSNCLWLRDKIRENIHGEILWRDSNLSHQDYTYDQASRLTEAKDTVGGQCTTRRYAFERRRHTRVAFQHEPGDALGGMAAHELCVRRCPIACLKRKVAGEEVSGSGLRGALAREQLPRRQLTLGAQRPTRSFATSTPMRPILVGVALGLYARLASRPYEGRGRTAVTQRTRYLQASLPGD
ncbi:MAG TPA: hypothetical protein VI111_11155 [Thermoleophilaceae bacterium]